MLIPAVRLIDLSCYSFTDSFIEWFLPHTGQQEVRGTQTVLLYTGYMPSQAALATMYEHGTDAWRRPFMIEKRYLFFLLMQKQAITCRCLCAREKWSNMRVKQRKENYWQWGPKGKTAGNPSPGVNPCKLQGKSLWLKRLFLKKAISSPDTKEIKKFLSSAVRYSYSNSGSRKQLEFQKEVRMTLNVGEPVPGQRPQVTKQKASLFSSPWNTEYKNADGKDHDSKS